MKIAGPKKCPNCDEEMDEELADEGICSECGEEFYESVIGREEDEPA